MADYSQYHALGQGEGNPNDPNRQNTTQQYGQPGPYQQQQPYGAPQYGGQPPIASPPAAGQPYGSPSPQAFAGQPAPGTPDAGLAQQMGGMSLGADSGYGTARRKKKDRHAYHTVEATGSSQAFNGGMPASGQSQSQFLDQPAQGAPAFGGQFGGPQGSPQMQQAGQYGAPATNAGFMPGAASPGHFQNAAPADASATIGTSASGPPKVSPDDLPSVPVSRDGVQPFFFKNVYPTFEKHIPPPAAISYVAFDQGNASPKYARLTVNNIPSTNDGLQATGLPLGLLLQPLAPQQAGEAEIPVLDFGDAGPPRCRRCRAYINPFMMFRSGGNKFVCNLCTHPNETSPEYFCATNPQGVRVDRDQRPELHRGTVEFVVPKEYWTKEPVGLRWLFAIDVTQESYNKGFLEAFCEGILSALYGGEDAEKDENGEVKRRIPEGAKVGFLTYDKDIHFYNVSVSTVLGLTRMMLTSKGWVGHSSNDDHAGLGRPLPPPRRGLVCGSL